MFVPRVEQRPQGECLDGCRARSSCSSPDDGSRWDGHALHRRRKGSNCEKMKTLRALRQVGPERRPRDASIPIQRHTRQKPPKPRLWYWWTMIRPSARAVEVDTAAGFRVLTFDRPSALLAIRSRKPTCACDRYQSSRDEWNRTVQGFGSIRAGTACGFDYRSKRFCGPAPDRGSDPVAALFKPVDERALFDAIASTCSF